MWGIGINIIGITLVIKLSSEVLEVTFLYISIIKKIIENKGYYCIIR